MLLWKRWGSSTGDYPSGFEEEYKVADANEKDIWLYFREVPDDMVKDPVEDLRRKLLMKKNTLVVLTKIKMTGELNFVNIFPSGSIKGDRSLPPQKAK